MLLQHIFMLFKILPTNKYSQKEITKQRLQSASTMPQLQSQNDVQQ